MSGERFAEPSLDSLFRRRRSGGGTREPGRRVEPRIPDALANSDRSPTSEASPGEGLSFAPVSSAPAPGPRSTAAGLRIGSLPYLVLIALVAVGITGAFFGSGFLLLKQPATETVAGPTARDEPPSAAPESPAPNLDAASRRPDPPRPDPPRPDPPRPDPPRPDPPPARSAAVPEATPTASPAAQAAADPQPLGLEATQARSVPDIPPPHSAKHRLTAEGHHHYRRTAPQRSHARSAPQPAPEGSFDRLLSDLTGGTNPPAPSLTPPKGEQPDPFAQPTRRK
jgi:hypothetical protein